MSSRMDSSRGRQPGLCGQIPGRQILVRDYRRRANHRRGSRVPDQPTVETSAKTPAVAASEPTAPTSQRFMRGGHQDDSDQRNVGSYHFLTRDSALLLRWRIALDSSTVHALDATFKMFAAHHGRFLLDCCHAGTHARQ